jgi:hypothetical protein
MINSLLKSSTSMVPAAPEKRRTPLLTQMDDDGKEFVIAYASQSNNNVEAQYSSYEGEYLATIWAIAHF